MKVPKISVVTLTLVISVALIGGKGGAYLNEHYVAVTAQAYDVKDMQRVADANGLIWPNIDEQPTRGR